MSQPIDDIEREIQEETAKHAESKTKVDDILSRFMEGNARAKTVVDSYRATDRAIKRKPKHA